jgi:hypothetical protein
VPMFIPRIELAGVEARGVGYPKLPRINEEGVVMSLRFAHIVAF